MTLHFFKTLKPSNLWHVRYSQKPTNMGFSSVEQRWHVRKALYQAARKAHGTRNSPRRLEVKVTIHLGEMLVLTFMIYQRIRVANIEEQNLTTLIATFALRDTELLQGLRIADGDWMVVTTRLHMGIWASMDHCD